MLKQNYSLHTTGSKILPMIARYTVNSFFYS